MSNAASRDMNRRTYIQWAFEIAAAVSALIWWKWMALAVWWTPQESIEARAVGVARLAGLVFPAPMLNRMQIVVDTAGHVNTAAAILDAIQAPAYANLRLDAWIYLCTPPLAGLVATICLLYLAHVLRTRKDRRAEHVRGAEIDDRT